MPTELQYVSDAAGEAVAVIVPIEFWREIESERETAYLLRSEVMKDRLLTAKSRTDEAPWRKHVRNLVCKD